MNDIFKLRTTDRLTLEKYKLNLEIRIKTLFKQVALRSYSPKIWNALPYHIKISENFQSY